jgi:hypothetical protein
MMCAHGMKTMGLWSMSLAKQRQQNVHQSRAIRTSSASQVCSRPHCDTLLLNSASLRIQHLHVLRHSPSSKTLISGLYRSSLPILHYLALSQQIAWLWALVPSPLLSAVRASESEYLLVPFLRVPDCHCSACCRCSLSAAWSQRWQHRRSV